MIESLVSEEIAKMNEKLQSEPVQEAYRTSRRATMSRYIKKELYFSKTTGTAHFVPPRHNRWAIRADGCKPNEAIPIMSYRTGRSLVSGGNDIVSSVNPPMCFQCGTIEFSQKDYWVNH
jgi:hypothetical protein